MKIQILEDIQDLLDLIDRAAMPGEIGTSDWVEMYWEHIVENAHKIRAGRV